MGAFDDFLAGVVSDCVNAVSYDRNGQPFTRDEDGNPVPAPQCPEPTEKD